MKLKIESGVALPLTPLTGYQTLPWREMKIGDSCFVPAVMAGPLGSKIRQALSHAQKRNPNYHFTTRKMAGGYRFWRMSQKK